MEPVIDDTVRLLHDQLEAVEQLARERTDTTVAPPLIACVRNDR